MNSQRISILVLAVSIVVQVVIFPVPTYPQITDEKIIRVDRLLSRWGAEGEPGLVSAIIKDGQIVFEKKDMDFLISTPGRVLLHILFSQSHRLRSSSRRRAFSCSNKEGYCLWITA